MTTAAIDRTAILNEAWAAYRRFSANLPFCRKAFGSELRRAWAKAKLIAHNACPINRIRSAITALESKARLTDQDYARLAKLRSEMAAVDAHADAAPAYAEKRSLIENAKGRFCAVTFTKKDGSERVMQVQPATLKAHVKGDKATDAGKRAVATRKALHPNLLPVWDAQAKAPRSINLATVSRIAVDGTVHEYAS